MLLVGRQSSHYTRLVRIVAAELGVALPMQAVHGLMSLDPANFGGHPGLRLPVLQVDGQAIYGSLNICRVIADRARLADAVAWPESSLDPLQLDAHELVANAMAMHLELVMHEVVDRRQPDITSTKRRAGLVGSLRWLDERWPSIRAGQPPARVSLLEASLFCLLEHLDFRNPLEMTPCHALDGFRREFGTRASARATPYRFDAAA